jgi:hypothetical protein
MYNQGLRICNTQTTQLSINIMTLLNIANKVIGCDTIGGVPVYGVTAQWFVDQFMELVRLDPTAAQLDDHKILLRYVQFVSTGSSRFGMGLAI